MSLVGKNIRKIRTVKKMSQAAFAKQFNLARPSIGAYEEGRAEPKLDTVIQIAQHFNLSIDMLLTKELTINELYHFDAFIGEEPSLEKPEKRRIEVKEGTSFVKADQLGEFTVRHSQQEFLRSLEKVVLPGIWESCPFAFELKESYVMQENNAFLKGSVVIGKQLSNEEMKEVVPGTFLWLIFEHQYALVQFLEMVDNKLLVEFQSGIGARHIDIEVLSFAMQINGSMERLANTHNTSLSSLEKRIASLEERLKRK